MMIEVLLAKSWSMLYTLHLQYITYTLHVPCTTVLPSAPQPASTPWQLKASPVTPAASSCADQYLMVKPSYQGYLGGRLCQLLPDNMELSNSNSLLAGKFCCKPFAYWKCEFTIGIGHFPTDWEEPPLLRHSTCRWWKKCGALELPILQTPPQFMKLAPCHWQNNGW